MSGSVAAAQALLGTSAAVGLAGLAGWRFRGAPWTRWLWQGGSAGLSLAGLLAWGARWIEVGHLPLFGTFESALSLSVAVLLATLWWERRGRGELGIAPVGALIAAATLGHGLGYETAPYALTISERSLVVDAHALVSWAAFAVLAVNAGLSAVTLWGRGAAGAARGLVTTLEWGFFLHTGMLVTGAAYRFLLFGRAWAFDPIETLGLVAWVSYGTLLHLHFFAHWRDRRLAAWGLGLFALLVLSYRGIVYFPSWSTYHIFDVGLREHLMR